MTVPGRAIIGLVALYALLLQAFLGFATPAPAHAAPGAALCAEHPVNDPDHRPIQNHVHVCCTVVQAGALALPVAVTAAPISASAPAMRLSWHPAVEQPRTGPPRRVGTARGPPVA